jgi:hypothetical protein
MGSGGMDILMVSHKEGVLPAVGEINAGADTVGLTFALVQSLMYSAQIATRNQFMRLRKHYEAFDAINVEQPRVDVIILLEPDERMNKRDLRYAVSIANDLSKCLSAYLRHIVFSWFSISGDAVKCEIVKPE